MLQHHTVEPGTLGLLKDIMDWSEVKQTIDLAVKKILF